MPDVLLEYSVSRSRGEPLCISRSRGEPLCIAEPGRAPLYIAEPGRAPLYRGAGASPFVYRGGSTAANSGVAVAKGAKLSTGRGEQREGLVPPKGSANRRLGREAPVEREIPRTGWMAGSCGIGGVVGPDEDEIWRHMLLAQEVDSLRKELSAKNALIMELQGKLELAESTVRTQQLDIDRYKVGTPPLYTSSPLLPSTRCLPT
ncbi:hypothetical protein CYMTET_35304, partial [Cymbomonas tetramitiformis]